MNEMRDLAKVGTAVLDYLVSVRMRQLKADDPERLARLNHQYQVLTTAICWTNEITREELDNMLITQAGNAVRG
jgi:hypothetical protein